MYTHRREIFYVPESTYYREGDYKPCIWLIEGNEDTNAPKVNNYEHVRDEEVPEGMLLELESLWIPVPSLVCPGEDWPGGDLPDWQ